MEKARRQFISSGNITTAREVIGATFDLTRSRFGGVEECLNEYIK